MLKLSWIPTCQGWSPRFIKLFRLAARWTRQLYGSFPCSNLQKENIVTHQPEKLYFLQQEALQILCSQISLHSSIPPLWKNSHGKTGRYFNQEMALISISNSCFPFNSILHSAVCLWKLPLITFFISQCSEMANGPAHLISPSCMIMFHQVYSVQGRYPLCSGVGVGLPGLRAGTDPVSAVPAAASVGSWGCDSSGCQQWLPMSLRACQHQGEEFKLPLEALWRQGVQRLELQLPLGFFARDVLDKC